MIPLARMTAFREEMEKLAFQRKLPPSKKKKPVERVPAPPPDKAARVLGGMLGGGMIVGQVPLLKGYAKGRGTYYHATDIDAAAAIADSPAGIDPSFAGKGQRAGLQDYQDSLIPGEGSGKSVPKKARINRYLMGESFNRLLESNGIPLEHADLVGNLEEFNTLMDSGMPSGKASQQIFDKVTGRLVSSGKMSPAKAAEIGKKLQAELPMFGQRVYMGAHAADVLPWASGKSEGQLAVDKLRAKAQGMGTPRGAFKMHVDAALDASTGGLVGAAKDAIQRAKMRPHSQESVTLSQVAAELKKLRGSKTGVVFGAEAPTQHMGYMQDFPVVKHIVNLNPGLKTTLKDFIETYEPGRDLSFSHNIPSKNFKTVDIVDHVTGNIRRLNISDATRSASASFGSRIKNLAIPVGIAGLGSHLIYRAVKPKKKMVPKGSPLAMEKESGVKGDVWNVAKYVLPVAIGGGAVGAASHAGMRKLLPLVHNPDGSLADEMRNARNRAGRMLGSIALSTGAGLGIGALAGPRVARRLTGMRTPGARALGATIGAGGALMFAGPSITGSEQAMTPEADPYWSVTSDRTQDFVREHPTMGAVLGTSIAAALPIASAYTLRKYYPATYANAAKGVRSMISMAKEMGKEVTVEEPRIAFKLRRTADNDFLSDEFLL